MCLLSIRYNLGRISGMRVVHISNRLGMRVVLCAHYIGYAYSVSPCIIHLYKIFRFLQI
jgi:hypothetical protein